MTTLSPIRSRVIAAARERTQTAPRFWDRDCRACLALAPAAFDAYRARTGRASYHLRGGDLAMTLRSEEIHADHVDAEVSVFLDQADAVALARVGDPPRAPLAKTLTN